MSTTDTEIRPQYLRADNDPTDDPYASFNLPKPNWLERIGTDIFNMGRRRKTKQFQIMLEELRVRTIDSLRQEVLSSLAGLRDCHGCKQQFALLQALSILSILEEALRHPVCEEKIHQDVLKIFLGRHQRDFIKARMISAWICGFEPANDSASERIKNQ